MFYFYYFTKYLPFLLAKYVKTKYLKKPLFVYNYRVHKERERLMVWTVTIDVSVVSKYGISEIQL